METSRNRNDSAGDNALLTGSVVIIVVFAIMGALGLLSPPPNAQTCESVPLTLESRNGE